MPALPFFDSFFDSKKSLPSHPALWRASDLARVATPGVSSGFAQLDAALPGQGWPVGALTELLPAHEGIGELRVLGPALAHLSAKGERLAWIAPPHLPYAPALLAAGIDIANLVIVRMPERGRDTPERGRDTSRHGRDTSRHAQETLWATEQALASNACGAVLAWLPEAGFTLLRRLQLAAEAGRAMAILFRHPRMAGEATPAVLRIALDTLDGGLALRILKRRGAPLNQPVLLPALPGYPRHAVDCIASPESAARGVLARRVMV